MNMQTNGEEMDLINGFFQINGKIGYVLKPEILLNGFGIFSFIKITNFKIPVIKIKK